MYNYQEFSTQGLICLLTKNNVAATEQVNTLLCNKIIYIMYYYQGLICCLTQNNVAASEQLYTLLYNKIIYIMCYYQEFSTGTNLPINKEQCGSNRATIHSPLLQDYIYYVLLLGVQYIGTNLSANKEQCCSNRTTKHSPLQQDDIYYLCIITRSSVQGLICLLTKNNVAATEQLNTLLYNKMNSALQGSDQVS